MPRIVEVEVSEPAQLQSVRTLFQEYQRSIDTDLCFQGFTQELAGLPGAYAAPRGRLLLATDGAEAVGCIALRPIDAVTCEMKRLYVRPAAQGRGLGRELAQGAIRAAQEQGYERMRLDTLPQMQSATALYRSLGFVEIAPYYATPHANTLFFELALRR